MKIVSDALQEQRAAT
jgi:hypothetical protein